MFKSRIKILIGIFCIIFSGLLFRLFNLQVINAKDLKARQSSRINRLEQVAPRRGNIYDSNGIILAEDTSSFELWIYPAIWKDYKGKDVEKIFSFLPIARVKALLGLSGDHRSFEKKLIIEYIKDNCPFIDELAKVTGIDKNKLSEKILNVAKKIIKDRAPGALFFPRKFIKDVTKIAYLKILSQNALFGDNSSFRLIKPKTGWKRRYPFGEKMAHILGYVSPLSSREYEKLRGKWGTKGIIQGQGYIKNFLIPTETEKNIMRLYEYNRSGKNYRVSGHLTNSIVGRTGIEQEYNNLLRGSHGLQNLKLTRPEVGGPRILQVSGIETKVQSGQNITLTINSKIQAATFDILKKEIERIGKERNDKFAAACILIDPNNGEIKAMVSLPSFNPYLVSKKYKEYISKKNMQPFLNRTISEVYPPGSTFKPIVAMAALTAGVITEKTEYTCNGLIRLGNHDFICMRRYAHGPIDVHNAIRLSCNVFFYNTGRDLGRQRLYNFTTDIGLNSKTGIDIPNEAKGIIPDGARTGRGWATGNTFHMSIGQGTAFTPMEMAVAISAIANGGKIIRPHLIALQGKEKASMDKPLHTINVSDYALKVVRKAMWGVVNERGTGRRCAFKTMAVSGKSGSADWKKGEPTHAWFVAYAPSENPQIVAILIIPRGNLGGGTCSPIVRKILKMYFDLPDESNTVG